jgi:hypothetical protein
MPRQIAFRPIAHAALRQADAIVRRWLHDGFREGAEWIAINPTRNDRQKGSFKVNLRTGAWSDFATGDRGRDLISLGSYIYGLRQAEAAVKIAAMLGIDPYED